MVEKSSSKDSTRQTDRHRQAEESRFQHFIASFPGVAYQFRLNPQGGYGYDYLSEKCLFFFGVPATEIIRDASLVIRLIPEPDLSEVKKAIRDSAETMTPYQVEHRILRPDGRIFWLQASSTPERMADGNIVWNGVAVDITDLRLAEEARLVSEKSLNAAEVRYRTVVEEQTELISRFSADGKFLFVNEAYCRFFQKKHTDLIGRHWQPIAYAKDHEKIERRLSRLSPALPVVVIENRVYKGDGSIRWVQFINRGIFDSSNQLIEIQSVGRDISDLKEIQIALQQKEEELSLKNRRLEKLNIAFEVVIEQKNEQLDNLRSDIIKQYNSFVKPHVEELKKISQSWQENQYLKLIEQGMQHILSPFARQIMSLNHHLSPMETKVATLITSGTTIMDAARELKISPHTVKYHRKNIRSKLGIQNKKINLRSYLEGRVSRTEE